MIQHLTSAGQIIGFENPPGIYPVNSYQSLVLASASELAAQMLCVRTGHALHELRAWEPCCGGGPVAVSLKSLGLGYVQATDVNAASLEACRRNAALNGLLLDRVTRASWLNNGSGEKFDLICCNPPCGVSTAVPSTQSPAMRRAVDGGADGVSKTLHLIRQARSRLSPHGSFVLIAVSTTAISRLVRALDRAFPGSWRVLPAMPVAAPWARETDERFLRLQSEPCPFKPLLWRRADGFMWRLSWVIEASLAPDAFPGAGTIPLRPFGHDFAGDPGFTELLERFSPDGYRLAIS